MRNVIKEAWQAHQRARTEYIDLQPVCIRERCPFYGACQNASRCEIEWAEHSALERRAA